MVLLVGTTYKCTTDHHTVYLKDPRLIQRIAKIHLPLILLHRTGFTRAFIHSVVSLAKEGLPIRAIVRHIQRLIKGRECSRTGANRL